MQVNPEDGPPEIYVTWSDPRMTDFENRIGSVLVCHPPVVADSQIFCFGVCKILEYANHPIVFASAWTSNSMFLFWVFFNFT